MNRKNSKSGIYKRRLQKGTLSTIVNLWVIFSFANGDSIQSFEVKNDYLRIRITNYGATIQELWMEDKNGVERNVVYGFHDPKEYQDCEMYLGSCIGRYAGRLTSPLTINEKTYTLKNTKDHIQLHGGKKGFNKKVWKLITNDSESITFSYLSRDGEEGYPGNLEIIAEYRLDKNRLNIKYTATTDATTVVNLTNHSHFKLSKDALVAENYLQVSADSILETSKNLMPTGRFLPVKNSPYDFRKMKKIGAVKFDTTFYLDPAETCLTYFVEDTGICMNIGTDQHGMVIFKPSKLNTICFETQNFSNAPNFKHFPSAVLHPGEVYEHNTFYEFTLFNTK